MILGDLAAGGRDHTAIPVEDERGRAGGALVDRQDVHLLGHGSYGLTLPRLAPPFGSSHRERQAEALTPMGLARISVGLP